MERKKAQLLSPVAELFDLPPDLVAGLPHLELIGQRQLYLAPHAGLLSYTATEIDINTSGGILQIQGDNLTLLAMTAEEVRVGGRIDCVRWVQ